MGIKNWKSYCSWPPGGTHPWWLQLQASSPVSNYDIAQSIDNYLTEQRPNTFSSTLVFFIFYVKTLWKVNYHHVDKGSNTSVTTMQQMFEVSNFSYNFFSNLIELNANFDHLDLLLHSDTNVQTETVRTDCTKSTLNKYWININQLLLKSNVCHLNKSQVLWFSLYIIYLKCPKINQRV